MPVGVLQLEIFLPESASLKDRRQAVRSVKDRLRQRFNVSVAELDPERDLWQRATLGIAAIAADANYLQGLLAQAGEAAVHWLPGQDVQVGSIEILD
ncbi:MAG TPA: DUF503 domain-containing protein [Terriglobales bacterium]|nr:DUF503 domain-containing protein [Terriglobales bacterium]